MLIPMPAMPDGPSPASVTRMSWVMQALLIVQTIFVCIRLFLLLDIMGGFINAIVVGIGWYAWKEGMNIRFICYWGFMALIQGAFNLVKFIDAAVHSPVPVFSSDRSGMSNFLMAVEILDPISMLLGAWLAYSVYDKYSTPEAENASTGGTWFAGSSRASASFNTFSGSGQRLGTN
eukprot:TRINITY_DN42052_c0_g1_i1.p1 TRINITY_DN42052_c0_g1~~TRINITY_DN42052_c0_g1_i1.p1  ORF type:complete len:176 (-),score=29.10 TRINITY_DN42052_c0_g1_i1:42-569(-)